MRNKVHSMVNERVRRARGRLLALQAEFAVRGFALEPLTGDKLIVQRWGLYRVLDGVEEAQRYLDQVGGVR